MRGLRRRGRAAPLLAALAVPPVVLPAVPPAGASEACPPARIQVEPSYRAPDGYEYATKEELRERTGVGPPTLGHIESAVGWSVEVGIRKRCLGDRCRLCVDRIEGRAGFEPGRIRVVETLRGDRCRTEAVLAHEERHARVFEESTRLGVRKIVESLSRWAGRQLALEASSDTIDAMADTRYREIDAVMKEGVGWIEDRARLRNDRIDSPSAYRSDIESMERRCG